MNIGWPEGIIITLFVLKLMLVASLDGKPKTGEWKFASTLVGDALFFALLWWGGLFA